MTNTLLRLTAIVAVSFHLAACAAIFNKDSANVQVSVSANAQGGEILVDGQPTGVSAPGVVRVNNHKDHVIAVRLPTGQMSTCTLDAHVSVGYVILDVVFTGLLGIIIDGATGAWKNVDTTCMINVM